jgi:hypothetical protein
LSELVRLSPSQQYDDIDIQQNLFVHVYKDMIYDVEFHMFWNNYLNVYILSPNPFE